MKSKNSPNTLPLQRSIRLLLINDQKELLLMRADDPSTKEAGKPYQGPFWFTIGGQLEAGETFETAALRELKEETGLTPEEVALGPIVWRCTFDLVVGGIHKYLEQDFMVVHTRTHAVSLGGLTESEQKVIQELRWFSLSDIQNCPEAIYPKGLGEALRPILEGRYPESPIDIGYLKEAPEAKIHFEKAQAQHETSILKWLKEPHVQAFWDNSDAHREDILRFIKGDNERTYCGGVFTYWIAKREGAPYAFIMTSDLADAQNETIRKYLSESGKTCSLDFMIGDPAYLGQGLGAKTLKAFMAFMKQEDPSINVFMIDPYEDNPRAKHVYEQAGFVIQESYTSASGYFKGKRAWIMTKHLPAYQD